MVVRRLGASYCSPPTSTCAARLTTSQASAAMPCALSDCGACGGIARVVHQSWVTRKLPDTLEPLSARWRLAGPPGWDHRLWTDEANRALWATHFPDMLPVYDGYPTAVQRADVTRLLYMHVHGGVYADLDVAPCNNVWAALERKQHGLLLVRGPDSSHRRGSSQALSNFFMASAPGHPFWAFAIRLLPERRARPVMSATGPWFLNAAWSGWQRHVRRQLSAQCAAAWLSETVRAYTFDEWQAEVAAHHWMGTWHHNHTVAFNPFFQDWMGVNRSNNCLEASFREHISRTWVCKTMRKGRMIKVPPLQRPSSAPAPPQGTSGSAGQLGISGQVARPLGT